VIRNYLDRFAENNQILIFSIINFNKALENKIPESRKLISKYSKNQPTIKKVWLSRKKLIKSQKKYAV
jgi:hypothetical protein